MSCYTYYLYKYLSSRRKGISNPSDSLKVKCSNLLKSNKAKDIIIKSLLGSNVSRSKYSSFDYDKLADAVFDIIYSPNNNCKSEQLPPIAVVVQNEINESVMADLVFYSTTLYRQYKMLPIVLIISIKGYACEKMKAEFGSGYRRQDTPCLTEPTSCLFWAHDFYILTWESIDPFIKMPPMDKLVALVYCILNTGDILKDQLEDPTIKLLVERF